MSRAVRVKRERPGGTPDRQPIPDAEADAMLRAAIVLFARWGLTDAEAQTLLGRVPPRTYARWKKEGAASTASHDVRCRLSYLMGIHKALRHMFKDPERAYAWIRKPNTAFAGRSALERMLGGDVTDLAAVRAYLDAERGGW